MSTRLRSASGDAESAVIDPGLFVVTLKAVAR
jgi:hypothetical protein